MHVFSRFSKLLDHYRDAGLILVDIPIGLPEGPGGRDADRRARELLGHPRGASVFPTPTRQTVQRTAQAPRDYTAAAAKERRTAGKGISRQTFAIAPKIAEVDKTMLARDYGAKPMIREVHPELCFWALNGRQPMEFNKKRSAGARERLKALQEIEPRSREIFEEARPAFRKDVARDDILDALVAAVTAYRGHGRLQTAPQRPPTDAKGLPMEIVYYTP